MTSLFVENYTYRAVELRRFLSLNKDTDFELHTQVDYCRLGKNGAYHFIQTFHTTKIAIYCNKFTLQFIMSIKIFVGRDLEFRF